MMSPRLPIESALSLEPTPDEPFLFVRVVADTPDRLYWSGETRITIETPAPPLNIGLEIQGLPAKSYQLNTHHPQIQITGDPTEASQVGLAWSHDSTARHDPERLRPAHFDGYNVTHQTHELPQEVPMNHWRVPSNTTMHLRAWALVDGVHHWSSETRLESTPPPLYDRAPGDRNHTIHITNPGIPIGHLASFDPPQIEIRQGEALYWVNQADSIHTATRDTNETAFHTGNLAPGATSEGFRFLLPGEYTYRCAQHPETMEATIIVTG